MTVDEIVSKLRAAAERSHPTEARGFHKQHIDLDPEDLPPNSVPRAELDHCYPCTHCGRPVRRYVSNWWHVEYAKAGEVCLHPSPDYDAVHRCGLCGSEFEVDGWPDQLAVNGAEVVVCPTCSRLEGD